MSITYEEKQEALLRTFGVVHAYDDEQKLFIISPDRLGFGVIADPLAGANQATIDSLNALLNLPYPKDTIVQFIQYASPDLEETLHHFWAMRAGTKLNPLLSELTEQRMQFLRKLTREANHNLAGAKLRYCRVVITVQLRTGAREPSKHELTQIAELQQSFAAQLNSIGLRFEALTSATYVRFMETVLNHSDNAVWRSTPWPEYESDELLCNQILDSNNPIDVQRSQLLLGGHTRVRLMSPKRYPPQVFPGMAMRYLGDIVKGTRAMSDPLLVAVNLIYPDQEPQRNRLIRDFAWSTRQSSGPLSRYVPEFARKKRSLDIATTATTAGDQIAYAYIGAATFSETDDAAVKATTEVQSTFRELGFQVMQDACVVLPLFSQLLPFGAESDIRPTLLRYRTLPTRFIVPLLPVMGAWEGNAVHQPLVTLTARNGQLMTFNPFISDGNYNGIIAAQSGMGKSFLANHIATNVLTIGGRVWIIDKGYSYKKLCRAQGGQYIEFTPESNICLNPFSIVKDFNEEADILANLIAVMAAPREGLGDFQAAAVKRVLAEQWDLHGTALTIDQVAEALIADGKAQDQPRISDVGQQLFPFTSQGQYGRFFNGENNIDMDNPMVVLELQQLSGRPHLQRLVLLQLMYQIQQGMDHTERKVPKLLLIDEAWSLLATDETEAFIVGWYRQLRKFYAAAFICTQSINDFFLNKGALAIIENSAHKLLLGQKGESIAAVKKEGRLHMTDAELSLLESVHTVPGAYSEIMIKNIFGVGVGRLVESPFNNLLYSSAPQDVDAIQHYLDQGLDQITAIHRVLRDRTSEIDEFGNPKGATAAAEEVAA